MNRLLTVDQAATELGVTRNVIDVWITRGLPTASRRPTLLWSHDVYDYRLQRQRRDRNGRFTAPLDRPNYTVVRSDVSRTTI